MILLLAILLTFYIIDKRADKFDLVHLWFDDFMDYFWVALQNVFFLSAQSYYYLLIVLFKTGDVLFVMQLHFYAFLFLQA